MSKLRPYQIEIIDRARSLMTQGVRSILIQSPTGSGKTLLTSHMMATAAKRGLNGWFIVHRRELVKQSVQAFEGEGISHAVVASGFPQDFNSPIQIASIGTLARRINNLPEPRLIIWDECHHIAAKSWSKIYDAFPRAFHIGLTATPQRLDGEGLAKWFQSMINGPAVSELIRDGYLSPYRIFAPATIDTAGIHTRMGDFVRSELATRVDRPTVTGNAIREYKRRADGKRAVVFCVSVEHSKHVAAQFNAAGITAQHVDGETDNHERDKAIENFREGRTKVLTNVELFGEGFDLPGISASILLRPTQSLGLYLQQVGRALRPSEGKEEAIILDHAGNCERHGFPDEPREWLLEGRSTKKGARDKPLTAVKICEKCFAATRSFEKVCTYCGNTFESQAREVKEVEGDLVEVKQREHPFWKWLESQQGRDDPIGDFAHDATYKKFIPIRPKQITYNTLLKFMYQGSRHVCEEAKLAMRDALREFNLEQKKSQARSQSLDELIRLGEARGYKNPAAWARYVFKGRQQKRARNISPE